MPRQTPRTMAQRAVTCDWLLLHLVGVCWAEKLSGRPLVEMAVVIKIRVTCRRNPSDMIQYGKVDSDL
jgi:hypothetical protein